MSQSVEEDFVTFDLVTGFKACLVGCSSTKMENGLFSCPPNIFAGLAKAFSSWQPFSTPVWKLNKILIKQSVRLEKATVAVALPTCGILNSNFAISYLCCPRGLDPNIVRYTPKSRPFWCISCGQTCICLLYTPWSKVFGILPVDIVSKHKRRHCLQKVFVIRKGEIWSIYFSKNRNIQSCIEQVSVFKSGICEKPCRDCVLPNQTVWTPFTAECEMNLKRGKLVEFPARLNRPIAMEHFLVTWYTKKSFGNKCHMVFLCNLDKDQECSDGW